jgi:hypothetical protein
MCFGSDGSCVPQSAETLVRHQKLQAINLVELDNCRRSGAPHRQSSLEMEKSRSRETPVRATFNLYVHTHRPAFEYYPESWFGSVKPRVCFKIFEISLSGHGFQMARVQACGGWPIQGMPVTSFPRLQYIV